jgi:hypothetical protein
MIFRIFCYKTFFSCYIMIFIHIFCQSPHVRQEAHVTKSLCLPLNPVTFLWKAPRGNLYFVFFDIFLLFNFFYANNNNDYKCKQLNIEL